MMATKPRNYEPATVDRVKNAKVGDWLWVYDKQRKRTDLNGQYLGRGDFVGRYQVKKIARKYFSLKTSDWTESDFYIETGESRSESGYTPLRRAMGQQDVEDFLVTSKSHQIGRVVETATPDQLRKIAAILGVEI